MGTWFDTLPPDLVDAAGVGVGDRYGLWMRLARMHLATLPGGHALLTDPGTRLWQDRYEAGWPPRQAAFAAWNSETPRQQLQTAPPSVLPTAAEHSPSAGREMG